MKKISVRIFNDEHIFTTFKAGLMVLMRGYAEPTVFVILIPTAVGIRVIIFVVLSFLIRIID